MDVEIQRALRRSFLTYLNTLIWTWSVFRYPSNDHNFSKKLSMHMVGIYVKFELFSTVYASCHMSEHLFSFFTEKTLENAKIIENQNNLPWCLELAIQGHGNNWGHLMDVYFWIRLQ